LRATKVNDYIFIKPKISLNMQLVILAGGCGTRIAEKSDYVPKPMVKIRKKPILWHIIKYYKVFGFSEFIIRVGYKIEVVEKILFY
jgi:glucose-1-phosphate cytidylyltransferase